MLVIVVSMVFLVGTYVIIVNQESCCWQLIISKNIKVHCLDNVHASDVNFNADGQISIKQLLSTHALNLHAHRCPHLSVSRTHTHAHMNSWCM